MTNTDTVSQDDVRELELYADNTAELYPQFQSIIRNIKRKIVKGTYDPKLAPKLWRYWFDAAAKGYKREHGWLASVAVRQTLAEQRAVEEYEAILRGEYADDERDLPPPNPPKAPNVLSVADLERFNTA